MSRRTACPLVSCVPCLFRAVAAALASLCVVLRCRRDGRSAQYACSSLVWLTSDVYNIQTSSPVSKSTRKESEPRLSGSPRHPRISQMAYWLSSCLARRTASSRLPAKKTHASTWKALGEPSTRFFTATLLPCCPITS